MRILLPQTNFAAIDLHQKSKIITCTMKRLETEWVAESKKWLPSLDVVNVSRSSSMLCKSVLRLTWVCSNVLRESKCTGTEA